MTHSELTPARIAALRATLGDAGSNGNSDRHEPRAERPAIEPPPPMSTKVRIRRAVIRMVEPVIGPIARRAADAIAVRVAPRIEPQVEARLGHHVDAQQLAVAGIVEGHVRELAGRVEQVHATVRALSGSVDLLGILDGNAELFVEGGRALHELKGLATNLELLKGQFLAVQAAFGELQRLVDQVGRAIAPDAGVEAAAHRFAELRDHLARLDRSVRSLQQQPHGVALQPAGGTTESTAPAVSAAPAASTAAIDYVALERRFRGDPAEVLAVQKERYLDLLRDQAPVLDVGCGRGELLRALRDAGIQASGVDLDRGMVDEARAAGLDVVHGDALAHLAGCEPGSLGAVVSMHVMEHLPFDVLVAFIAASYERLRPGGLFVAETPNPTSLIVLGQSFILDPSHVWPLHPSLVTFLCEQAGFAEIEIRFHSPATYFELPLLEGEVPPWAASLNVSLDRLNHVLFGPQEYAVVARKLA